jgi:hypothetical protein
MYSIDMRPCTNARSRCAPRLVDNMADRRWIFLSSASNGTGLEGE